jgi:hypothetical protein
MGSPRYPLEPVAGVRRRRVEVASVALAKAAGERDGTARALRGAELRRVEHDRRVALVTRFEQRALNRGELAVADLARAHAWALRAASEARALAAGVERAKSADTLALGVERSARATLAGSHADSAALERHRERWDGEQRRASDAREEEASAEAWRPGR